MPFSGGPAYAILFWATYALWIVLETIGFRTKRSLDIAKARDRGSFRFIMLLLWLGLGLDFALSFRLPQATILWKGTALLFVGIAPTLVGMAFRFYAMSVLGRFFTYDVAVRAGQTVIEVGPYRYIRHPSYSGALITLVGLGLALGHWAGLLALLARMGAAYTYRISVEEAALVAAPGRALQGVYAPDATPRPVFVLNGISGAPGFIGTRRTVTGGPTRHLDRRGWHGLTACPPNACPPIEIPGVAY